MIERVIECEKEKEKIDKGIYSENKKNKEREKERMRKCVCEGKIVCEREIVSE